MLCRGGTREASVTHIFKYGGAEPSPDFKLAQESTRKNHEQRQRFGDSTDMSDVALCGLEDRDPMNPLSAVLIDYLDQAEAKELCPACALRAKQMGFDREQQAQARKLPRS
jgi:hypothetical protein